MMRQMLVFVCYCQVTSRHTANWEVFCSGRAHIAQQTDVSHQTCWRTEHLMIQMVLISRPSVILIIYILQRMLHCTLQVFSLWVWQEKLLPVTLVSPRHHCHCSSNSRELSCKEYTRYSLTLDSSMLRGACQIPRHVPCCYCLCCVCNLEGQRLPVPSLPWTSSVLALQAATQHIDSQAKQRT